MGFLDNAKEKLSGLLGDKGDDIDKGLDKAGDFIDDKTGGKFSDKIDAGVEKAKNLVDQLDGEDEPATRQATKNPVDTIRKDAKLDTPRPEAK